MAELAASRVSAAGGGRSELEKAQRKEDFEPKSEKGDYAASGPAFKNNLIFICGYGGIGRRIRFRILRQTVCRFDPCYPHQTAKIRTLSHGDGVRIFLYIAYKRRMSAKALRCTVSRLVRIKNPSFPAHGKDRDKN